MPRLIDFATLAVTAAIALAVSAVLTFSHPAELRVDGQRLVPDVPPITTSSDGVFVPLRALDDALGADTHYTQKTGTVVVRRGDQTLQLKIGDRHAKLNGMPMTLSAAPFRVRDRVMVGLSAVSRAFGVRAHYDKRTARIDVNTPGIIEAGARPDTP